LSGIGKTVSEKPAEASIAVGSNIDPQRHILEAFERIKHYGRVTGVSTFYRTPALGRPDQPPFINGVWRFETSVPARALKFDVFRKIESELGRVRTADKYADRTIDLDIVLYGDTVIDEPDLKIPDPDIRTRPFIAIPLLELAPDLVLPDTGEQLASIASAMEKWDLHPTQELTLRMRTRVSDDQDSV
jgi:dihydroneopterin aldolase/2-amino-4-hydroxy-6-hydroxymethyldihydropteridine diphosphokinase